MGDDKKKSPLAARNAAPHARGYSFQSYYGLLTLVRACHKIRADEYHAFCVKVEGEEDVEVDYYGKRQLLQIKHSDNQKSRNLETNDGFWDSLWAWSENEKKGGDDVEFYKFVTTYQNIIDGEVQEADEIGLADAVIIKMMNSRIASASEQDPPPKYLPRFEEKTGEWKILPAEDRARISEKIRIVNCGAGFSAIDDELEHLLEKRVADPLVTKHLIENILGWWGGIRPASKDILQEAAASDVDQQIKLWMSEQTSLALGPSALNVSLGITEDNDVHNCKAVYMNKARDVLSGFGADIVMPILRQVYAVYNFANAYHLKLLDSWPNCENDIQNFKGQVKSEVEKMIAVNRIGERDDHFNLTDCLDIGDPLFRHAGDGAGAQSHLRGVVQIISDEDGIRWTK